ncbi:MAG: hypothetical protein ACE37H_16185 [Phycisphaeraceae bacterium]
MSQPTTPADPSRIALTQNASALAKPKANAVFESKPQSKPGRRGCVCDCGGCPCGSGTKPGDKSKTHAKQGGTDASE